MRLAWAEKCSHYRIPYRGLTTKLAVGKRGGGSLIVFFFFQTAAGGAICFFSLQIVNTLIKNSSCDDRPSISKDSAHDQPAWCQARPTGTDDGLEDVRWIHGLGGESLPAASYALLSNLKQKNIYAIRNGSRFFVMCFVHTSGRLFFIMHLASARHISPAIVCTR